MHHILILNLSLVSTWNCRFNFKVSSTIICRLFTWLLCSLLLQAFISILNFYAIWILQQVALVWSKIRSCWSSQTRTSLFFLLNWVFWLVHEASLAWWVCRWPLLFLLKALVFMFHSRSPLAWLIHFVLFVKLLVRFSLSLLVAVLLSILLFVILNSVIWKWFFFIWIYICRELLFSQRRSFIFCWLIW